jgi:hypothetical protein
MKHPLHQGDFREVWLETWQSRKENKKSNKMLTKLIFLREFRRRFHLQKEFTSWEMNNERKCLKINNPRDSWIGAWNALWNRSCSPFFIYMQIIHRLLDIMKGEHVMGALIFRLGRSCQACHPEFSFLLFCDKVYYIFQFMMCIIFGWWMRREVIDWSAGPRAYHGALQPPDIYVISRPSASYLKITRDHIRETREE